MQDVMDFKEKAKKIANDKPSNVYISPGEIIDIHNSIIDNMKIFQENHYPQAYKVQDMPLLIKITKKQYKTVEELAGSIFFDLSKKEPFYTANKRTGVLASEVLLARNGLMLGLTDNEIYNLSLDITDEKIKKGEFLSIFKTAVVTMTNDEIIKIQKLTNEENKEKENYQYEITDYLN